MKVVILAGGKGTRIVEESHLKPKPMIELVDMPIIWHIMKSYSHYGFNEFIICAGYKAFVIKEFFENYYLYKSDITFDFSGKNLMTVHDNFSEPWKVTIVDTGIDTMTGGRIKRIKKFIGNETFLLTYGDGVTDLDIGELVEFHKNHKKKATITAVQPGGRFGAINLLDDGLIKRFAEKKREDGGWINGGFMVLEPDIFDYISGDDSILEKEPLEILASKGELMAFMYRGFWQCMDTLRDKIFLEELIKNNQAPWIKWE